VKILFLAIALSLTPTAAFAQLRDFSEYQYVRYENLLSSFFSTPDGLAYSAKYARTSDYQRRTDAKLLCFRLERYTVSQHITFYSEINQLLYKNDSKRMAEENFYLAGVAVSAVEALCTENRASMMDWVDEINQRGVGYGKAPAPSTDLFTSYMNQGYDAVKAKNYDSALILFRMALNERPNNSYALKAIENVTNYINKRSSPKPSSTAAKHSRWVVIGTTSTGETLSLDLSSAYFTGSADYGESAEFTYKFIGNTTTRVNKAVTESCEPNTGKLVINGFLGWDVTEQNGKTAQIPVKAESEASKRMLERVCSQAFVMFKKYGIPGK
jgi:hypothetical protein